MSSSTSIVKSPLVSARPATRRAPTRSFLPSACPLSPFLALYWPRLASKASIIAPERQAVSTTTMTTKASPSKSAFPLSAHSTPTKNRSLRASTTRAATGDDSLSFKDEEKNDDLLPLRAAFARVVLPLALALCLCNADRICLAVAIVPMSSELRWSPSTQGLVQSAFLVGYAATQLLGGRLADRLGGRVVLGCGIAFFSLAQLATPALLAFASGGGVGGGGGGSGSAAASAAAAAAAAALVSSRTLAAALFARAAVGLGEGVALPSMSSLVAAHVPRSSRATALGASFSGFHCGNLLGLALSPVLLARTGWRGMFAFFGLAGAPLLVLWFALVPSPRKEKRNGGGDGEEKKSLISSSAAAAAPSSISLPPPPPAPTTPPSPRALLSSRHTWAIIAANVANHWGYFVYLSWLPTYFHRVLGLDLAASAAASLGPWVLMACGSSASGALADWLVRVRKWSVRRTRVTLQLVAFLVPAAALAALVLAGGGAGGSAATSSASAAAASTTTTTTLLHPALAIALVATALGTTSLGQAGFVANMADVAPRAAGSMFGLCNTFGSAAGIAGVAGAGWIVERTGGSFAPLFLLTAGLYCVGAAVFASFASGEAVF